MPLFILCIIKVLIDYVKLKILYQKFVMGAEFGKDK